MFVKAWVLVSGKPIQPNLMFASKARAYPSEAPLGTTNIRLGWNGFSGKNTLAYYKNLQGFITFDSRDQCYHSFYGRKISLFIIS